jgi:hypothetical protein
VIERRLRQLSHSAAERAYPNDAKLHDRYSLSATPHEIELGLGEQAQQTRVLCYQREILGLPTTPEGQAFCDFDEERKVDRHAELRLSELKPAFHLDHGVGRQHRLAT